MRVLVVYAHPVNDSFNAAVHRTVVDTLTEAGHAVTDLDLYATGFEPALSADERRAYDKVGENTATVAPYVAQLQDAEGLALCFPTWWYGLPAILKGWLDRVWLPGVTFHLPPDGGRIRPGLTNIRRFGVATTAGSPWWFMRFYMAEPAKRVLLRGIRPLCAPDAKHFWLCHYAMDKSTPETRARYLEKVKAAFEAF